MGWAVGYDENWQRDIGYGVPATCDHPGCGKPIDRGLAHACGGEPYGGEDGCGLHFCGEHLYYVAGGEGSPAPLCEACADGKGTFKPTPDTQEWIEHKLTCPTWADWRAENPEWVAAHNPLTTAPNPAS